MTFFVPCDPPRSMGKNSKNAYGFKTKDGRYCARVVENPNAKEGKAFLASMFAPYAPQRPLEGPVSVSVRVTYPWPKSVGKKARIGGSRPKVTRPDVDGFLTGVLDVLAALRFYGDDSQVYCVACSKFEGDECGVSVAVEPA